MASLRIGLRVHQAVRQGRERTGSAQVQVALPLSVTDQLTDHMKSHQKDPHSSWLMLVGKRRRLLFFKSNDIENLPYSYCFLGIRSNISKVAGRKATAPLYLRPLNENRKERND